MWSVTSARAIGASHLKAGGICEDFCHGGVHVDATGRSHVFLLVSDGAGTAEQGALGAKLTIRMLQAYLIRQLDNPATRLDAATIGAFIGYFQPIIAKAARDFGLMNLGAFACTLIGAVISPEQTLFFQIGDGALIARMHGAYGIVFWPDSGTYANQTFFVTETDAWKNLHVAVVPYVPEEVILFTDGLQRLALDYALRLPHLPFIDPLMQVLRFQVPGEGRTLNRDLKRFLSSAKINSRTEDDKTLLIATRERIL